MGDLLEEWLDLRKQETNFFNLEEIAFKQQLRFINDGARLKALFCTRRAAKSFTGGLYLIREALSHPGTNHLFIGLTRQSAHGIVWKDILRELDRRYKLNIKFNETLLTATLPNGSVIWVTGADTDEQEMNKLLGKKYKLVVLDEASMFTVNVHQLVYGVLKPATADQRGTICLLGTASNITRGLFYDITTGREPGWSLHQWTAYDNPHVAEQWAEELAEIRKSRPLFEHTTLYRQWYLNEWVVDESALLIKYHDNAEFKELSPAKYTYIMGVDIGFNDADAIAILAWGDSSPTTYLIEEKVAQAQGLTELVQQIQGLRNKYDISKIVIDEGGLGKKLAEEMRRRHHIPVQPAEKARKMENVAFLNDAMMMGNFKAKRNSRFVSDSYQVLIDKDKTRPDKIVIHDAFHSDIIDAVLYAFKESPAYSWQAEVKKPKYKTPEWYSQEVTEMERAAEEHFEQEELREKGMI